MAFDQDIVDLATIAGGFGAAAAAFVAAPFALFQLWQAERLRRLDFYQALLMELYAPGATQEIAFGAKDATADAEATRLRGEASKLIKAAIVLKALRRVSAADYGELFETIESDVRGTIDSVADVSARMVAGLATSSAPESASLKDRFELINVMCQQAKLVLEPDGRKERAA